MDERAWSTLIARIRDGKCTPFIGAGADAGVLPLGGDVASAWASKWAYPLDDVRNLIRVAQFLAVTKDPLRPKEMIAAELGLAEPPDFGHTSEPHGVLADLDLPVYITTNYDDFMTTALKSRGRNPHREYCRWNKYTRDVGAAEPSVFDDPSFRPTPDEPVVYHLHGIREKPESMVLTEDDYLEFVVNLTRFKDLLPPPIQGAFAGSSLLFIGYSLQDWTFKVLFKGLVGSLENSTRRLNLAVQLAPGAKPAEEYLDRYFRGQDVGVYWGTATDFVDELRTRVSATRHMADEPQPVAVAAVRQAQRTASGGQRGADEMEWANLLDRIGDRKCTPFIGAGAAASVLPLGGEVAVTWAEASHYPLDDDHDLTRVAQYLAVTGTDAMEPKERIARELQTAPAPDFDDPLEPHGLLADLHLPLYITTNYDDFMTRALRSRGSKPHQEICRWNKYTREVDADGSSVFDDPSFRPTPEEPVVFHLHGTWDKPESMVLTEDDYLEFVVNLTRYKDLLPAPIQGAFAGTSLLFVGYSLQDWTFKVLFKGLIGSLENSTRRLNLAVQLSPGAKPAEQYLDRYFEGQDVGVYWGTATDFTKELRNRLDMIPERT